MRERRLLKSQCVWWMIPSVCFALFTCTVAAGPTGKKPQKSTQTTKSDTIEYRVGRRACITENSKALLVVLVSIDPKHFVRDDILKLAQQLKQDFESEPRVRVDIFDDHSAASVWDPVHFYGGFQAAHRGTYYRDVKAVKEYIEFSVASGKHKKRLPVGK